MTSQRVTTQLNQMLKAMSDSEMMPAFYICAIDEKFNKFIDFENIDDHRFLRGFIESIQSIKNPKELRDLIMNYYSNQKYIYIEGYIDELNRFKTSSVNKCRDLEKFKSDKRYLAFAINYYQSKFSRDDSYICRINDEYMMFLFIVYCHPYFSQTSCDLDNIESQYSNLLNQYSCHFKNYDNDPEFYQWSKKYMDENPDYGSQKFTPTSMDEYRTIVNIIFDRLYFENKNIYDALKKKLSNARYQRDYRKNNKGTKPFYFPLSLKAQEALKTLAFKRGVPELKLVELLINEGYAKECLSPTGADLYSSPK